MDFLIHCIVLAVALAVTANIVSGVTIDSWPSLVIAAVVLGVVNALVKPILTILTLPVTLLTLGLFYLVVNALCFSLAAWLSPGFHVASFGSADHRRARSEHRVMGVESRAAW